ncbi:hypothetical protein QE152_g24395 [Popillia japonica]|uniref:Uncharacterized protein n=1 Tax=Popillia japonica TaxID=7064 RepID=A0AAW1KES6_POPJA
MTVSMQLQYHSDKCLSKINSKSKKDFNQHSNNQQSVKKKSAEEHLYDQVKPKIGDNKNPDGCPEPKPRRKVPQHNPSEQYKNVINDLEKQIKKSVRFNERKTEIQDGLNEDQIEDEQVYSEVYNWADNHELPVDDLEDATPDKSPTESEEEKVEESKDKDEENEKDSQGRTSEWVEEQNKYFLDEESEANTKTENVADLKFIVETSLNRNDSGYYESPKKIRQRIPPRKIYPSSSELSESASSGAGNRSDTESCSSCENVQVFDIYKNGRSSPLRHPPYNQNFNSPKHSKVFDIYKNGRSSPLRHPPYNQNFNSPKHSSNKVYRNSSNKDSGNDFLIPRPKLIVPIHSYAVRKRRTGNLSKQSVNYSDYENICVKTLVEDEEFGVIEVYRNSSNKDSGNDFLIPRPKLIVPIHSYAVRKRRTGNLSKQSVNYSDYENICVKTLVEDEEFGVIEDQIEDEQVYSEMYNWANNHEHAVDDMEDATPDKSTTESEEEKVEEFKDTDEENEEDSQGRTSEWVEEQNKYYLDDESEANTKTENVADPKFIVESSLKTNDSGYY